MGLDMYLAKKRYIGNKYRKPEEQVKVEGAGIKQERVTEITEDVAYWRKANAIHKWFVDNVQHGVDDCGHHPVSREQLKSLSKLCQTVLASSHLVEGKVMNGKRYENGQWVAIMEDGKTVENADSAKLLLPTTEGFFFGGTDYDEWYIDSLQKTVEQIEAVLAEDDTDDYEYQSSW